MNTGSPSPFAWGTKGMRRPVAWRSTANSRSAVSSTATPLAPKCWQARVDSADPPPQRCTRRRLWKEPDLACGVCGDYGSDDAGGDGAQDKVPVGFPPLISPRRTAQVVAAVIHPLSVLPSIVVHVVSAPPLIVADVGMRMEVVMLVVTVVIVL